MDDLQNLERIEQRCIAICQLEELENEQGSDLGRGVTLHPNVVVKVVRSSGKTKRSDAYWKSEKLPPQ